jgi:hypothetical protein
VGKTGENGGPSSSSLCTARHLRPPPMLAPW